MAYFASFAGIRVVSARITRPPWGMMSADIELADATAIPARGDLVIGNLTLACASYRTGDFAGSRMARLVGGAGGWRRTIALPPYRKPGGVSLSTVLKDAAAAAGETIVVTTDATLGVFFVPARAPASDVLRRTIGTAWYVDAAGTTRTGAWPTTTIATDFTPSPFNTATGKVTVATEDLASWKPGAVFTHPTIPTARTVASVSIEARDSGRLRLEVFVQ